MEVENECLVLSSFELFPDGELPISHLWKRTEKNTQKRFHKLFDKYQNLNLKKTIKKKSFPNKQFNWI